MTISSYMKIVEISPKMVGKGEVTHYEQFLLFPTMFSKDLFCRLLKQGLAWEKVKAINQSGCTNVKNLIFGTRLCYKIKLMDLLSNLFPFTKR